MSASQLSLTLIPPRRITTAVELDIRAAVRNTAAKELAFEMEFYIDSQRPENLLAGGSVNAAANGSGLFTCRKKIDRPGEHRIICVAKSGDLVLEASSPLEIIQSDLRITNMVEGAWAGITHWSDAEGRLWKDDIPKMTDRQWREFVQAMKNINMDIIVIQEVFRNQYYVGKHNIENEGYQGRAYYQSKLFPGRMKIAATDPIEAILSEADKLDMYIFPGIGLYAWFDFTKGSLEWHKKVADELWQMYGHHKSFYGWYVSEEIFGNLGEDIRRKEIIEFFKEFKWHVRNLSPDKPVMLAPNCHDVPSAVDHWPKLLENIDILCPFGFHRMPQGDISGEESAQLLQRLCDDAGSHLWMDMEAFLFAEDTALYPRPIDGLVEDMRRFPNFEKILCYQFPGIFNAPWASIKPGGEATVKLYQDYEKYITGLRKSRQKSKE